MFEQWRNYKCNCGGRGKRGLKGPIFKQYRARWGIVGPFLRPCEGPKFEVTPLCLGGTPRESRMLLYREAMQRHAILC